MNIDELRGHSSGRLAQAQDFTVFLLFMAFINFSQLSGFKIAIFKKLMISFTQLVIVNSL